ncbi:MAG: type II and III secretion system protein [Rhodospirillaceae bacterium]
MMVRLGARPAWAHKTVAVSIVAALVAGCAAYDKNAGLERADYENLMARRGPEQARPMDEPPIPDLQPILAAPTPPELADQRRVSVSVTQATSVQDLLVELARKADVDLDLDPRIQGGIILQARERPFEEVVRRIADLAGLRYTLANNVLRMELDEPYMQHYRMDMLNLTRSTTSKVDASTDVFSAVGNSAGGGTGSSASIESESVNNFWEEIQSGIAAIISEASPATRLVQSTAAAPAAAPQATASADSAQAGGAAGQAQEIADQTAAAAQATPAAPAATIATAADAAGENNGQYYTLNRQAGIITVYTTQAKQKRIKDYLAELRSAMQAQVLIEAKVIEVALDDSFRAGIDWNFLNLPLVDIGIDLTTGIIPAGRVSPTLGAAFSTTGGSLGATVQFMSTFGTARTLSSPRLTVVNNETALLKVAENRVYFTIDIEREINEDTGRETRTFSSELNTVPIGLLMQVQPSINLSNNQISLSLRPTISRVVDQVEDPAVQLVLADINATNNTRLDVSSPIPVVEVREIDSVVTMESGSVLIMGGLMQERSENEDEKVPGLGDVPLVGNAFKKQMRDSTVTELVIFLRATIVRGRDSVHQADVDLYNTYTPDPRPIGF